MVRVSRFPQRNSPRAPAARPGKLLNTLTKTDLKQMAKSKEDKAREFVLGKEHFEKQQVPRFRRAS